MDEVELRHERVKGEGGVALHVARAGTGPAVILLHGFPQNWRCWRKQLSPLVRAGFSVHAPDLRGYGESDRPRKRGAYRMRHLVGDVAALVRATDEGRAHVVGHDWGGVIAWGFAAAHPELLDRLVILNAPHPGLYLRNLWRPPQLFKSWYVGFFLLPWLPERVLAARDFHAVREIFRKSPARRGAFTEEEIEEYIAALRPPGALKAALDYYRAGLAPGEFRHARTEAETLVIWGERDPALSVRLLDGLDRFAPRSRVLRLPDVGHWTPSEAPNEVNAALAAFLQGGSPPMPRL